MKISISCMIALRKDPSILYDHRSNQWIGVHMPLSLCSQFNGSSHVFLVHNLSLRFLNLMLCNSLFLLLLFAFSCRFAVCTATVVLPVEVIYSG